MYIQRNTKARSRNHLCRGKATSIKCITTVCLCSCLSYPVLKSHLFCVVLYFHLTRFSLYHISAHCFINGTISVAKYLT